MKMIAEQHDPRPMTEAEVEAGETVAKALDLLAQAGARLASALEPMAAVEAERSTHGPHPLELLIHVRAQVEEATNALRLLQRSGLKAGKESVALGTFAMRGQAASSTLNSAFIPQSQDDVPSSPGKPTG